MKHSHSNVVSFTRKDLELKEEILLYFHKQTTEVGHTHIAVIHNLGSYALVQVRNNPEIQLDASSVFPDLGTGLTSNEHYL